MKRPGWIGPCARNLAERKLAAFRQGIDAWREFSFATDFD